MSGVIDSLLNLNPAWLLALAGLLVFAEDAIFVGFVVPGETAAVVAGVGSALQHFPVLLAMAVIVAAAIVGDSVGYEVGRRYVGPRLLTSRLLLKHQSRIENGQEFLRRRGGVAVFLGRFTAFLRAVMPALAGVAEMRYRTFLAWNAAGGLVWGTGFVLLGHLAGNSYRQVEHQVGRSTAIAVAVIVIGLLVAWRVRAGRKGADPA